MQDSKHTILIIIITQIFVAFKHYFPNIGVTTPQNSRIFVRINQKDYMEKQTILYPEASHIEYSLYVQVK